MIRLTLLFYICLLFVVIWSTEFRQERAKLRYANPKYMSNVSVITRRVSRRAPYRTNLTGNILVPFGNNVTLAWILQLKNGGDFKVQVKTCDCMKIKWMVTYMRRFSNLPYECPIPAGWYAYINMELPPSNAPVPTLDGDYYSIMELYVTSTKELIMSAATYLHFDNRGPRTDPKTDKGDKGDKNKNKNKKG